MIQQRTCPGGPVYYSHEALDLAGVRHGFFTRKGGLSTGLYDSLNCGLGSDDNKEMVQANRSRVASAMGLELKQMAALYQIHSPLCNADSPWPLLHRPATGRCLCNRPDWHRAGDPDRRLSAVIVL